VPCVLVHAIGKYRSSMHFNLDKESVALTLSLDRAGIGGVVFGATEERLLAITGSHDQNPTMSMPCREVSFSFLNFNPYLGSSHFSLGILRRTEKSSSIWTIPGA
jgi:hypothetical protein